MPFPPCAPSAAVRLSAAAQVAEVISPSPTASMGSSSSGRGGWPELAGWHRGQEDHRFDAHDVVYACQWGSQRRFCACLEDVQRMIERRDMAVSGPQQPRLYAGFTLGWFGAQWLPSARMLSDAVPTPRM